MLSIVLFSLTIIPLEQIFAGNCIQEFMPKTHQIWNELEIGQYALGLSKKSELNGKKGIITYCTTTVNEESKYA